MCETLKIIKLFLLISLVSSCQNFQDTEVKFDNFNIFKKNESKNNDKNKRAIGDDFLNFIDEILWQKTNDWEIDFCQFLN